MHCRAGSRSRLKLEAVAVGPVSLDPARLRQVILNFLSNAIKFTDAGGSVVLTVARDGNRLMIAVADTGVGIAPEDQRRIFDEFVQVGASARTGSGLGLAVTRQIVKAQGGEVSVTSLPDFGSTFRAWLPWMPALDSRESPAPAEPATPAEPAEPPERAEAAQAEPRAGAEDRPTRTASGPVPV